MQSIAHVPGVLSLTVAALLAPPAPAEEAPARDRTATLHLRNGKTVTGILELALSREVLLRRSLTPAGRAARYDARDVRWIESRGTFFAQDEASGAWKVDPQGGRDRGGLRPKETGDRE